MNTRTTDEIQDWIISYIAQELHVDKGEIPVDEQLVNLGLSSRQAIVLSANLETFLDRPTDPALIWEHPTISKLANYLGQRELAANGAQT